MIYNSNCSTNKQSFIGNSHTYSFAYFPRQLLHCIGRAKEL